MASKNTYNILFLNHNRDQQTFQNLIRRPNLLIVQCKQHKSLQRPSQQKHKTALEASETCKTLTKHHPHTQYGVCNVSSHITHVKQGLEHAQISFSLRKLAPALLLISNITYEASAEDGRRGGFHRRENVEKQCKQ